MRNLPALLVILALSGYASAQEVNAVEQRIRALVPDISSLAIAETPVPGMVEVQVNNDVLYMSDDGRYLIQGRLIDLDTQTDLTDATKAALRMEQIASLDEADMVTFGEPGADYELMVFTDTDCGYCRRLHEQIDEYIAEGIRIKYLAFPRGGMNSATFETMQSVWCADNPQQAMTLAKSGRSVPKAECDSPVEEQYRFGQAIGVTGTPALLLSDGALIPGYVPPQQLRQRLDSMSGAN